MEEIVIKNNNDLLRLEIISIEKAIVKKKRELSDLEFHLRHANARLNQEQRTVLVKITSKFIQDPNHPRPKWWDNYIGETFECYDVCDGWWRLSAIGRKKLCQLKGINSISAIIHKNCGTEL